ncbi:steroid delta-isomerase-like uncharacterized protein [Motilibacter rhizosphaerae]|uniref:Steroid delta-isomerase-like uncharacterized protein n=1 Tax=Motilibacter rhizosphaerae TaxID=598652 RepID=A0A4Q7NB38_9ACTN|nr:ester cyclase [Motilibacter rhizosphaerae]RZS80119.1 steroid delta-isomerase-like uncharacterized protein [Motilibacter rhizosphaerae]
MSASDARSLAQSYFDLLTNKQDLSRIDELFSPDIAFHDPAIVGSGRADGLEEVRGFFTIFFRAFPDVHFSVDDILAEDDRAAVRFTWTGTHKATFLGHTVSERHVSVPGIDIFHVADGKITEVRVAFDRLELVEQLGGLRHPL